jgi:hypothetical protein
MAIDIGGQGREAHCHRLAVTKEAKKMIALIRSFPPSGDLRGIRGNTSIWYLSRKMSSTIRAESYKIEFPSILELEYSNEYGEVDD